MGYFEGTLSDIVSYAVELPGFWQWGAGGAFKKLDVVKLTALDIRLLQLLQKRKAELEEELKEINSRL